MLHFTFDPNAGTLYTYFTELETGQAVEVAEYPVNLALDETQQICAIAIDLDDEILLSQLELVLEHDYCWLDGERGRLWLRISEAPYQRLLPLTEPAILDLDEEGLILGVEVLLPEVLRNDAALAALAPYLLALDEEPLAGEGPVVFDPFFADDDNDGEPSEPPTAAPNQPALIHAGFVALVGRPNVGKSTLLNALLGQKVAIVSPRPQTTRHAIRGILQRPGAQIVFVDTPGIHEPRHRLGKMMVDAARKAMPNADIVCMMVDISRPPGALDHKIAGLIAPLKRPKLLLLNKIDLRTAEGEEHLLAYRGLLPWDMELAISARKQRGLEGLLEELVKRLPQSPPLYPLDQVTDQSEQQLVAELIREKVLRLTENEVPHAIAVEIEEWEQRDAALYIRATINVERDSQKGIVIGAKGAMLKQIGSAARTEIEPILAQKVFLDLWVKARPNWRDDPSALGWLGFRTAD